MTPPCDQHGDLMRVIGGLESACKSLALTVDRLYLKLESFEKALDSALDEVAELKGRIAAEHPTDLSPYRERPMGFWAALLQAFKAYVTG